MFKAKAGSSPGVDELRFRNLLFDLSALCVSMYTWEQVGASVFSHRECKYFFFFFFETTFSQKPRSEECVFI